MGHTAGSIKELTHPRQGGRVPRRWQHSFTPEAIPCRELPVWHSISLDGVLPATYVHYEKRPAAKLCVE